MRTKYFILSLYLFFNSYNIFAQNVGIGTTTPTARLQINHSSTNTHPGVLLRDSTSTRTGLIRFSNISTPHYMHIWGFYDALTSASQYLDISSDSTFVATFRGNGTVGIGVTDPVFPLDVNGVINSDSEYRLNGKTVFRWSNLIGGLYRNFYAGDSAGFLSTGIVNTFVGGGAGAFNTFGGQNCFFGTRAGYKNGGAYNNTYIGYNAGSNSTGPANTFVGSEAGFNNLNAYNNMFIGAYSGYNNTSGSQNTFLGVNSGISSLSGNDNVFVGLNAGETNTTGHYNTLIGTFSDVGATNLTNATAIGNKAYVTQSNCIVLGSIFGVNDGLADTRVGIGTTAPTEKLEIVGTLKLSGEINNSSTGTANLLPIAFGTISTAGNILSGSGNYSVTRTATGSYTIDITDHSYGFSTYSTIVTAVAGPFVASTNSASGNLLVRLYNLSGVLSDGNFHFVVYKQ